MNMQIMNTQTSELLLIPLHRLLESKYNARKTGALSIEELADSIDEVGLLQNLVVVVEGENFGVIAGKRRRAALKLLLKQKRITNDYEVLCKVRGKDEATLISLTENIQRQAMHPADEFEAFAKLIAEGRTVEEVAAKFGVTPLVVQRRLKLANVSPRLIKKYREGDLTLDQLMALAIVDDHKAQEAAIANAPEWQQSPESLRDHLTADDINLRTDRVAKFVGTTLYEAAGGDIRRDLFAEQTQDGFITDIALLDKLACDKLAPQADEARAQGWAWVDIAPRATAAELAGFQRAHRVRRIPTAKEAERLAQIAIDATPLDVRLSEIEDIEDDEEWEAVQDEYKRLQKQRDKLEQKQQALEEKLMTFPPEIMQLAGAVVTIDHAGKPEILGGLLKKEDALALHHRARIDASRRAGETKGDEEPEEKTGISEALARKLTSHRTAALQIELAQQPQIALVALTHQLTLQLFYEFCATESPVRVRAIEQTSLATYAPDIGMAPATLALAALRDMWKAHLPAEAETLFPALLELPQDDLLALLALCVSSTLDAVARREDERHADELARTLNLDMRRWWHATGTSYFSQVSKLKIIEAVKQFAPEHKGHLSDLKKSVLVTEAERLAIDTGWLPAILATK